MWLILTTGGLATAVDTFSFPRKQGVSFNAEVGLRPIIAGKHENPVAVSKEVKEDSSKRQRL